MRVSVDPLAPETVTDTPSRSSASVVAVVPREESATFVLDRGVARVVPLSRAEAIAAGYVLLDAEQSEATGALTDEALAVSQIPIRPDIARTVSHAPEVAPVSLEKTDVAAWLRTISQKRSVNPAPVQPTGLSIAPAAKSPELAPPMTPERAQVLDAPVSAGKPESLPLSTLVSPALAAPAEMLAPAAVQMPTPLPEPVPMPVPMVALPSQTPSGQTPSQTSAQTSGQTPPPNFVSRALEVPAEMLAPNPPVPPKQTPTPAQGFVVLHAENETPATPRITEPTIQVVAAPPGADALVGAIPVAPTSPRVASPSVRVPLPDPPAPVAVGMTAPTSPTTPARSTMAPVLRGSGAPIISARKLGRSYRIGDRTIDVLNDIDLDIRAGEFVVIGGASGSGKTTLISCLAGLEHFDRGELLVEDHPFSELTENDRARHRAAAMGFIFQSFHLLPVLSVRENVELPLLVAGWNAADAGDEARSALQLVGLADREEQLPDTLSGGEQQRVAIARALVGEPRIVFADEPTGNLDDESAERIVHLLRELHADGLTVVVATHDPKLVALGTVVFEVKNGNVIERRGYRSM